MKRADLTPELDLTAISGTGPLRQRRPVYVDLEAPCHHACPAGENVQAWLALAAAGDYRRAWEQLIVDNPFPAVHGRVCYHPCETACNRAEFDAAVSIHAVERFLGDRALAEAWALPQPAPASGKRVLIVGAGPCGLSAAYHLARRGNSVEIHEAGPIAGGMLHFGIPAYRLPREELAREIARLEALGVRIILSHKVEDLLREQTEGRFDAVLLAIGAQISHHVEIPAREAGKILDAVSLLRATNLGESPRLGRRVVIYGGGNTAMDAARTAKRLGVEEALIIYRRDRAHMPAHEFEADEALAEGVKIRWLTTIKEISQDEITVERMTVDDHGRPHPTGEFETLSADTVILALGQDADSKFLRAVPGIEIRPDGTVIVDETMMTGRPGIFAGGDMVPTTRSVTIATGHGKRVADHIDAWLRQGRYVPPPEITVVNFAMLHLPLFSDVRPAEQHEVPLAERTDFREILGGLTEPDAQREAARCFSCGNCFECDNCFAACPEDAIIKLGPGQRYRYDYAKCTGCAVCFEQCPCHAIEMTPESVNE
jgi:NADPH-dependent glutamate synthase beta subunit-like oxidoreductase